MVCTCNDDHRYDVGVISGSLNDMSNEVGLSMLQREAVTSGLSFIAAIGALGVSGGLMDWMGRKVKHQPLPVPTLACYNTWREECNRAHACMLTTPLPYRPRYNLQLSCSLLGPSPLPWPTPSVFCLSDGRSKDLVLDAQSRPRRCTSLKLHRHACAARWYVCVCVLVGCVMHACAYLCWFVWMNQPPLERACE